MVFALTRSIVVVSNTDVIAAKQIFLHIIFPLRSRLRVGLCNGHTSAVRSLHVAGGLSVRLVSCGAGSYRSDPLLNFRLARVSGALAPMLT